MWALGTLSMSFGKETNAGPYLALGPQCWESRQVPHANFIVIFQPYHSSLVLRCSLGCSGIHYVAQVGLKPMAILLSQLPQDRLLEVCNAWPSFTLILVAETVLISTAFLESGSRLCLGASLPPCSS